MGMGPVSAIDGHLLRAHFSAHAGEYDRFALVQKRVVTHLAARLTGSVPLHGLVLDVGTGTGALAAELGGAQPGRRFVLTDIAHGMTRAAAQRLSGTLPCDGDARQLPFTNNAFSAVVSSSVYQWVDDLPGAFAEVARVLRPGGCFAVALFGDQTLAELRDAHRRAVVACGGERSSHVQNFPTVAEVTAALTGAGLACRDLASYTDIDWHADVPALLRQLKQIGAGNAAAQRPRGLASRQVMQHMVESYERLHRQPQGIPATYQVVWAIAGKP
jgi:malonyl-CoA O-methyltransferase